MAELDGRAPDDPVNEPPFPPDDTALPTATPRHRRPIFMTVVVTAIAAAGIAIWYGLSSQMAGGGSEGEVPVVRADPNPIKERPADPGGMNVPDQDKLVYDRIDGETERPLVERLLPPPETPMAPPTTAELAPDAPPPPPPPVMPAPIPESPAAAVPAEQVKPLPSVPEIPKVETAVTVPSPPATSPTPEVSVVTTVGDGFKVQLASVRSMDAARGEWTRLSKRHADVLGDLDLDVDRADLGSRGIFFRVRGGPIATEVAAKALCETMKSRDVGCLVIKP
jgi:hypothetical protein